MLFWVVFAALAATAPLQTAAVAFNQQPETFVPLAVEVADPEAPTVRGRPGFNSSRWDDDLIPGSAAPTLTVPCLDGDTFTYDPAMPASMPFIVSRSMGCSAVQCSAVCHLSFFIFRCPCFAWRAFYSCSQLSAYDRTSAVNQAMYSANSSLDEFFVLAANTTSRFLFVSHATPNAAAANDTAMLRSRLLARLDAAGMSPAVTALWRSRLHFAAVSVGSQGGWVQAVLANWTRPSTVLDLTAPSGAAAATVPRLDSFYAWLPWPQYTNATMVAAGDGCSPITAANVTKRVAFLTQTLLANGSQACSFTAMIANAQAAGAAAVVIAAAPGRPVQTLNCVTAAQCAKGLSIPASMVPSSVTAFMTAHGGTVTASCVTEMVPGWLLAVDGQGRLAEVGWIKYWSMRVQAWESQWYDYLTGVHTQLQQSSAAGALVVPVFNHTLMHGNAGAVATVALPPAASQYDDLVLDMALGCAGPRDTDCSIWDHTIELKVNCSAGMAPQELGRWITPFRRRVGRWLTPVTPLLPLLSKDGAGGGGPAPACTFTMTTPPWAGPWYPTLSLRFEGKAVDAAGGPPASLVELYTGSRAFNTQYNNRSAVTFATPTSFSSADLVFVVSGHGSDVEGCAEFCVTSHVFEVNRHNFSWTSVNAGTPWGCSQNVTKGSIPNEHGTWVYGRDFWCDGMDVKPHVQDVSAVLAPPGHINTVKYYGLFNGVTPAATGNSGAYIIMASRVVFWK